jgi:hypothetical protein
MIAYSTTVTPFVLFFFCISFSMSELSGCILDTDGMKPVGTKVGSLRPPLSSTWRAYSSHSMMRRRHSFSGLPLCASIHDVVPEIHSYSVKKTRPFFNFSVHLSAYFAVGPFRR